MVRAAQRLPGSGLSATTPVGLVGYSQGGGASASAAEASASYAPEAQGQGALSQELCPLILVPWPRTWTAACMPSLGFMGSPG